MESCIGFFKIYEQNYVYIMGKMYVCVMFLFKRIMISLQSSIMLLNYYDSTQGSLSSTYSS